MGNPSGFMEHTRELGKDRSPNITIKDWGESYKHLLDNSLKDQG